MTDTIQITRDQAAIIRKFLSRVMLSGWEVPSYVEVMKALESEPPVLVPDGVIKQPPPDLTALERQRWDQWQSATDLAKSPLAERIKDNLDAKKAAQERMRKHMGLESMVEQLNNPS